MESTPGSWAGPEALGAQSAPASAQGPRGLSLVAGPAEPGTLHLSLKGALDAQTSSAFKRAIASHLAGGAARVVLDLSALKRLDPTGLAALAEAGEMARRRGQRLRVAHLPESARAHLARASLHKVIALSEP